MPGMSYPFSLSTGLTVGGLSAVVSGASVGLSAVAKGLTNVMNETEISQRNSLIKALEVLKKEIRDVDADHMLVLNMCPGDIGKALKVTGKSVATTAASVAGSASLLATHISQLPLDIQIALAANLNSIEDSRKLSKTQPASTLNRQEELAKGQANLSANCRALVNEIGNICDVIDNIIDAKFERGNDAGSHRRVAKTTASTVASGALATVSLVDLVFDAIGSSMRELTGLSVFSQEESRNKDKDNIYQAFSACVRAFSESKASVDLIKALQELEEALSDCDPADEFAGQHSVSGPTLMVSGRKISLSPFVKSLRTFIESSVAISKVEEVAVNEEEKEKFKVVTANSIPRASLLKGFSEGDADTHCQNISDLSKAFNDLSGKFDNELSHIKTTAVSTVGIGSLTAMAASLIVGLTGLLIREISGSIDFTKNDKGTGDELKVVMETRRELSGEDLDKLMTRACQLKERLERCVELGVAAPVTLGLSHIVTAGSLIASLNVLGGMYSTLREVFSGNKKSSASLILNEAEEALAQEYAAKLIASNKKSAGSVGSESLSDDLSLHQRVISVMRTVVMMHRIKNDSFEPNRHRKDLNSVAKVSLAPSQGNSTGFLLGSLGVLALLSLESGIGIEALFGTYRYSLPLTKRANEGVDRCDLPNGSKSNISSASNTTRLAEEASNGSSVCEATASTIIHGAESTFSRTHLVALCHSGALKEMLKRLVNEEQEKLEKIPGFLDSTLVSANIGPKLEGLILEVLDKAEAQQNPIFGLNGDMASGLAVASNATIASALGTHATFIAPFLQSIVAAKKASVIDDAVRDEALIDSELSRVISTGLNRIQAFTEKYGEVIDDLPDGDHANSIMATHFGVNRSTARSEVLACATSLLCDELFEICLSRSITLLDKNKVQELANESKVQSQEIGGRSKEATQADSAADEPGSVSHVISALRLTLSHLGQALHQFACEMEHSPELRQNNLKLHSLQKEVINSIVTSLSTCASNTLLISGILSKLPLSSANVVDNIRDFVHSMDHSVVINPSHSSEEFTREEQSETTLITGIGSDCVSNIVVIATKLLLQASISGMDTSLSIARILEILCIDPRPVEALSHELQGLSMPNGLSLNVSEKTQSAQVASSVVAASASAATQIDFSVTTQQFIDALQGAVDQHIEKVGLLTDDEEGDTLKLKDFYRLLVKILLASNGYEANTERSLSDQVNVVDRFDWGGIAFSNFHSKYKGVQGTKREDVDNRFINEDGFYNCDAANSFINMFISRAYRDELSGSREMTLLNSVKQELDKKSPLSASSQGTWEYIVDGVISKLQNENTSQSVFHQKTPKYNTKHWIDKKTSWLARGEINQEEVQSIIVASGS